MKHLKLLTFFSLILLLGAAAACSSSSHTAKGKEVEELADKSIGITDLVLLYNGNVRRSYTWDKELLRPYVAMKDDNGDYQWMFDGFLLLELKTGKLVPGKTTGRSFASYYEPEGAQRSDWQFLLDHYLAPGKLVSELDECIAEYKKLIKGGKKKEKHKVVLALPEPVPNQKDWGEAYGMTLDFSIKEDRLTACKWFIDTAIKMFDEANFDNVQLAGFYWLAEEATNSRDLVSDVADYTHAQGNYSLTWIPYFVADGNLEWRDLGFDKAYLQPNYFFNEKITWDRLDQACQKAFENDMSLEMEFDERALKKHGWGYRFHDYMDAYEKYNVWETKEVAYYQGGTTLYQLWKSEDEDDQALYRRFANIIAKRQKEGIAAHKK